MNRTDEFWNFILNGDKTIDSNQWFSNATKEALVYTLYVISNPDGSPRWVFPQGAKQPLFLKFYPSTTVRSKVVKLIFRMLFSIGLIRLVAKKVTLSGSHPPHYRNWLFNGNDEFSLFAGTIGPNQKILVYEKDHSGKGSFKKIAFGENAQQLINNEKANLELLASQSLVSFTFPAVKKATSEWLEIQEMELGQSHIRLNGLHQNALQEWYKLGTEEKGYSALDFKRQVLQVASTRLNDKILVQLREMLLQTISQAQKSTMTTKYGFGHGDFTPWNCGIKKGSLFILDWELAGTYPLLYDAFHFVMQQEIMNTQKSATEILQSVYTLMGSDEWVAFCSENKLRWKNQFIAYLLHVATYYYTVYSKQAEIHHQAYRAMSVWSEMLDAIMLNLKGMKMRSVFAKKFFTHLKQLPYALMKNDQKPLTQLSENSDVDLFIDKSATKATIAWIKAQPEVIKLYKQRMSYMTVVTLYFMDGSFLSIDFIHRLKRKNIEYMTIDEVVKSAYLSDDGLKLPQVHFDLQYMITFYWLNHAAIPQKYLSYVQRMEKREQISVLNYLKLKVGFTASRLEDFFSDEFSKVAYKLHNSINELPQNKGWKGALNKAIYLMDSAKKVVKGKGLVISFSGVDGAGKSTVISHIKSTLETRFRRNVVVLRHRPSVLPILSAWVYGKKEAEARSVATLPRQGNNKNSLSSLFRFAYYLTDFLVGQFVIWMKHSLRGDIILYDRYYFDFIEDPKRSNIHLPRWFRKLFYRFVFKPNINIFLHAQPELILKRKQELDMNDIVQLTSAYKKLFNEFRKSYSGKYVTIENDDLDITLEQIESLYVSAA